MHTAQFSLALVWALEPVFISWLGPGILRWPLSRLMAELNLACTAADFSVWPWAAGHVASAPGVLTHTLVNAGTS